MSKSTRIMRSTELQEAIIQIARDTNMEIPLAGIARLVEAEFDLPCTRSYVSKVLSLIDLVPVRPSNISPRKWAGLSDKEKHRLSQRLMRADREGGVDLITCTGCGKSKPAGDKHWERYAGSHPSGEVHYRPRCRMCGRERGARQEGGMAGDGAGLDETKEAEANQGATS